ncbi:MAG: translation initiation factor IF-3 [Bacteroidia bacterium]|nr:translation initiation factor IF-3 [Bacteroidia bacterium]
MSVNTLSKLKTQSLFLTNLERRSKINRNPKRGYRGRVEEPYRVNEKIRVPRVRVVGENVEPGIYPRDEALKMAQQQGLDLVEISPKADPPVCKIIDYSKFKYEQKKKQKELKAKAQKVVVKEIRFGPNTDDHDFNFKLNHAKNFLKDGAKLKAYVHFVGRTIVFKERGELLLLKFAQELEDYGKVEQMPKLEGKRMSIIMSPKPSKIVKAKPKSSQNKEAQNQDN